MKKMPPIQKILETYTAIVDKHVELKNNEALVTSSNGAKTYTVSCEDNIYHSNDNATYWQGYAGYPIIAVLMLQGKISFDQKLADNFASVNWNEVNAKFKRNYAKTEYSLTDLGKTLFPVIKAMDDWGANYHNS